jgi:hypothetical protein
MDAGKPMPALVSSMPMPSFEKIEPEREQIVLDLQHCRGEEYARVALWSQSSVGQSGPFWTDPDPTK